MSRREGEFELRHSGQQCWIKGNLLKMRKRLEIDFIITSIKVGRFNFNKNVVVFFILIQPF